MPYFDLRPVWLNPAFINNWSAAGVPYDTPGFCIDRGVVFLKGVIKNTSLISSIFTLPLGYRPSGNRMFMVSTFDTNPIWTPGYLTINSTGLVALNSGRFNFVSLDGVNFRL